MIELGSEEVIDEQNRLHLKSSLFILGTDLLIIISGINDHIGSVTLAQPYIANVNPNIQAQKVLINENKRISASLSTITQFHHRDDQILAEFARSLSQRLNIVVTVIGGIHIDNISKNEIEQLSLMLMTLKEKIIKKIISYSK